MKEPVRLFIFCLGLIPSDGYGLSTWYCSAIQVIDELLPWATLQEVAYLMCFDIPLLHSLGE